MKKYLLIVLLLCLSSCSVDYKLQYKKGGFIETIDLVNIYNHNSGEETLKDLQKYLDNNSLNYSRSYTLSEKNEELKLEQKYNSMLDSSIIKKCFENRYYNDNGKTITIMLGSESEDIVCPYITDIRIEFISDTRILHHNADIVESNKYIWTSLNKGIELILQKNKTKEPSIWRNIIINFIILLGVILIFIGFILYRRKK